MACDPDNIPPRDDHVRLKFDDLIFGDTRTSDTTSDLSISGTMKVEIDGDTTFNDNFEWLLKVEKGGESSWCFRAADSMTEVPN